jgi:hypothetical protein
MKTWKISTLAIVAVLATTLLVSSAYAWCGGWGGNNGRGYGMGYNQGPYINQPIQTQPNINTPTTQYNQIEFPYQFGSCISRFGYSIHGTPTYPNNGATIDITVASTTAQNYVNSLSNPDLVVKEVEEYTNNFYVQINEKSIGKGAFELLINKYTGAIYPEMGPNMMWNTKYGMMRGSILGTPSTTTTITPAQATATAQQYLTSYLPGTTTGDVTAFYGYYTVEVLNSNGTTYGMLSVNGYTGQIWFHTWHGAFIQEL